MSEQIHIKVLKFADFTKRTKDMRRFHWFSFPVDMITHPDFYGITGDEFKTFIWIICVAMKSGSDTIRLDIDHACHILSIKKIALKSAIQKLQGKQIDVVSWPAAGHEPTESGLYKTRQDKTEQVAKATSSDQENPVLALQQFPELEFFTKIKPLSVKLVQSWLALYDAEWLRTEIKKATAWCIANPKRTPRAPGGFLTNWFARGYETHRKTMIASPRGYKEFTEADMDTILKGKTK